MSKKLPCIVQHLRRLIIAGIGILTGLFIPAIAEVRFQPAKPSICDTVTLIVTRTFEADCLWQVTPSLVRKGHVIDIMLDIRGKEACDAVITEISFDVGIGRLPAGSYDVQVHWSDESADELARLSVVNSQCEMNSHYGLQAVY